MSTQWWIHSNTRRSKDELLAFLRSLPGAGESSEFPNVPDIVEYRGHALAALSISQGGSADYILDYYGFLPTINFFFNRVLGAGVHGAGWTGFRETVYRVVSAFADWDDDCDIRFAADDNGILVRRYGHYLVNPHPFETPFLQALLPGLFTVADPPEANLEKDGWPPIV